MDEQRLRHLVDELRGDLPGVIADDAARAEVGAELERALALPHGEAFRPLLRVLRARPETRTWMAAREDPRDVERGLPGLPGNPLAPLGVHVVCPKGDYDRFLESPNDDPGWCPNDGSRLEPAAD